METINDSPEKLGFKVPVSFVPLTDRFNFHPLIKERNGYLRFGFLAIRKGVNQPKRCLWLLHGMGEHVGRYVHFPTYFDRSINAGIDAFVAFDHFGHGRSEGLRGHIHHFDNLAKDFLAEFEERKSIFEELQLLEPLENHVLGHSLGGHILLRVLLLNPTVPFVSATLSAPFLKIKAKVPVVKKWAALVLSQTWKNLQLSTGVDASILSHDIEVVKTYREDRLVHDKMTPLFFATMNECIEDTIEQVRSGKSFESPVMFLIPSSDLLVDGDVSIELFKKLKHRNKKLHELEGFYHEPFNEVEKEKVFAEVQRWILLNSKV